MAIGGQARGQVVGALACQRDAYLRTLETAVVSCEKAPEKKEKQHPSANGGKTGKKESAVPPASEGESERWLVEFEDSVLFPEGGGQPSDRGTIIPLSDADETPVPITFVERIGLRCVYHSPRPLDPGDRVLQEVDFQRRWDHMQQHTGQHLLSAVLSSSSNLNTVGWGMGLNGALNYVDLDRKPSQDELEIVQSKCAELIRRSLPITVAIPQDARLDKMPDDYDQSRGQVRVICIGDIDRNTCCGTHLSSTAHISLILTHHGETVHGTNFRLYFSAGDKAIRLATSSIGTVGTIARLLQCRNSPDDVVQTVKSTRDAAADLKKRERKLLADIAELEAKSAIAKLQSNQAVWVHRADGTPDFVKILLANVKGALSQRPGAVVVATGSEDGPSGQIAVLGEKQYVDALVARIKQHVPGVKGGGVGEKWQGKVPEWENGALKALETAVGTALGQSPSSAVDGLSALSSHTINGSPLTPLLKSRLTRSSCGLTTRPLPWNHGRQNSLLFTTTSEPVQALRQIGLRRVTPPNRKHDPYLAAALISLAQDQRRWETEFGPRLGLRVDPSHVFTVSKSTNPPKVDRALGPRKTHRKVSQTRLVVAGLTSPDTWHVYTADIPLSLLDKLDRPSVASNAAIAVDIIYDQVEAQPCHSFRDRLLERLALGDNKKVGEPKQQGMDRKTWKLEEKESLWDSSDSDPDSGDCDSQEEFDSSSDSSLMMPWCICRDTVH